MVHREISTMDREQILTKVKELSPWHQNIELPHGIKTGKNNFPQIIWKAISKHLPDLQNKRFLDIGCAEGFYLVAIKKRGADEVLGIDSDPRMVTKARFVCEVMEINAHVECNDLHNLSSNYSKFDVILMLGLLYHLKYPYLGLEIAHSLLKREGILFLETEIQPFTLRSTMRFCKDYRGDITTWFLPSARCVVSLLETAGFNDVSIIWKGTFNRYFRRCLFKARKGEISEKRRHDEMRSQDVLLRRLGLLYDV